jgi:hypothetical protein
MIKIQLNNNKCIEVENQIFRRLLTSSKFELLELKNKEGKTFPKIDKETIDFIYKLQSLDFDLI